MDVNAYFTGWLAIRLLLLNETLLQKAIFCWITSWYYGIERV
jgi:hypothetical protein